MEDDRDYLLGTVDSYSKAVKQKLLSEIIAKRIATTEPDRTLLNEDVVLGSIPKEQRLHECIKKSNRALKVIERYEFEKAYHYSIVMRLEKALDSSIITKNITEGRMKLFDESDVNQIDKLYEDSEEFSEATHYKSSVGYMFKLCSKVEQYTPDGTAIYRKFTMIVVVHDKDNLAEIRYDSVVTISSTNDFYITKINKALCWIEDNLGLHIAEADAVWARLKYIIEHKRELAQKEGIIITGQSMTFGDGSSADLYLGQSEAGILPLIGELRQFLQDHELEFENAPTLKDAFEDFLREKEQDSDWPWISLRMEYLGKKVEIKYTAYLYRSQFCRIMFYENAKYDAEVMNYVIEYITKSISNSPTDASIVG